MKDWTNLSLSVVCCGLLCTLAAGCSSLGFSTYPVAHFMTNQTKQVLDASPQRAQVPRELAKEPMPVHYLQPGDELLVEANNGDAEVRLPADQQIFADGTLDLGEYGRIVVASLTLEQAEQQIQRRLAESVQQEFTVNVRLIQPIHRYYVVGEVNSPGAYSLTGYETVLDGIMAAGGLTARASACDTLLARPTDPCSCRVTLPVCYRAITQLGDTTTNYQLRPGDRIFVGRQTFCEEFFPCCSKKTCQRCCDQQRPCCDPQVAARSTPEFGMLETSTHTMRSFDAPPSASDQVDHRDQKIDSADHGELPGVAVAPWPNEADLPGPDANAAASARSQGETSVDQAEQNAQDGQLDFNLP